MKNIRIIAIGQGGGPTPVINDEVAGALYEAKKANIRVYAMRNGLEGLLHADVDGNILDITNWEPAHVRASPGAILGTTRIKLKKGKDDEKIKKTKDNMKLLCIDNIAYFGGNDSSDILQALEIGVHGSKTIDNDLVMAHHTPGFGSAALFNAIAVKHLSMDIGSFKVKGKDSSGKEVYLTTPITIYQTMGRDTGWLALATGFARVDRYGEVNPEMAPDIIWPREMPFDEKIYLDALSNILQKNGRAFVVIGEELINKEGIPLADLYGKYQKDEHGHPQHARAGSFNYAEYLATLSKDIGIENILKIKETPITPQHIQRCYVESQVDSDEAFEVGRETVRAILDDEEQVSIVLQKVEGSSYYHIKVERVSIKEIAGKIRYAPKEYINNIKGPTKEFIDEFLPTIGGANALPHYEKLNYNKIVKLNSKHL